MLDDGNFYKEVSFYAGGNGYVRLDLCLRCGALLPPHRIIKNKLGCAEEANARAIHDQYHKDIL